MIYEERERCKKSCGFSFIKIADLELLSDFYILINRICPLHIKVIINYI